MIRPLHSRPVRLRLSRSAWQRLAWRVCFRLRWPVAVLFGLCATLAAGQGYPDWVPLVFVALCILSYLGLDAAVSFCEERGFEQ